MNTDYRLLFTRVEPQKTIGKIIQFPLTRIIIAVLFITPAAMLHNFLVDYIISGIDKPLYYIILNTERVLNFFLFIISYRLFIKYIERRPAFELSTKKALPEFGAGVAVGGTLILLMVIPMAVLGYYKISGFDSGWWLLNGVFRLSLGAFIEEMVFRLILFRLLEEMTGSWLAVILTSLFFGFAHLGNENATIWSSAAIAIQDLLIVGTFMYTRRLWMVWGLHFGWNYVQDSVFGMPNSGMTEMPSWIKPTVTGPEWFTGGAFGVEASYLLVLFCAIAGIFILYKVAKKNQIALPMWRRKKPPPVESLPAQP
ncbi:MAG: CPBP family intramembrane metalloprotease [candidate division Zixibacteria bacterium]|nr:CPBP family intramembrane metalloprotease [candidate division Zixibacteria bacterium]